MSDVRSLKNFCAMPFHHVQVRTSGEFGVCCQHDSTDKMNINFQTVDQWRSSQYMTEVRHAFLADEKHPGCHKCWTREEQGFVSMRQRTAQEYEILKVDVDQGQLTNVEIDLTNLCNLKCLMCNEYDSSSILAENVRLGINVIQQKDIKWSEQGYKNLQDLLAHNPKIVNIRGGEPFYVKELFELVSGISEERAKTMMLHITTNATVWSQQWQELLSKFKLVRFMFSVDAVDDLYEYIRFPGHWPTVESNVDKMCAMPNSRALVHCVVQNINVSYLGSLIEWCNKKSLWLNLGLLDRPHYMKLTNLPEQQKQTALSNLRNTVKSDIQPHLKQTLETIIKLLETAKFEPTEWAEFEKNITMRDQLRGNSYQKFILG